MRKSNQFTRQIWGVLVMVSGILLTGYSWATTIADIPPIIRDWRWGVGLGILLFFVGSLIFMWRVIGDFLWVQPSIHISTDVSPQYKDGKMYASARLVVSNYEELPITNCFATLKSAEIYFNKSFISGEIPVDNRLKWVETNDANNRCEITIPAIDHKTVDVANTLMGFRYHLCDDKDEHSPFPNDFVYGTILLRTLEIRIDGDFNDKAMKPQSDKYYIYLVPKNYNGEVITDFSTFIPHYYDMEFKKGDVMKNKTLKNQFNLVKENRNKKPS